MRKKWCTKIEGVYVHWPCWWLWHNTTLWEPQNAYFLTLHNLDLNFGTKGPNNKETFQFLTPKGKKPPDLEIGKNLGRILNRNLGLRWMMLGGNISNVHNGLHHLVISRILNVIERLPFESLDNQRWSISSISRIPYTNISFLPSKPCCHIRIHNVNQIRTPHSLIK